MFFKLTDEQDQTKMYRIYDNAAFPVMLSRLSTSVKLCG